MKKLVVVIVVVLAVFVIWNTVKAPKGGVPGQQATTSNDTVKFGVILPLTGDAAVYGEPALNVYKFAVDEINKAGGVNGKKLELVVEDSKCSGKDGANAAQKLVNVDKVQVIVGGVCSSETLAAIPVVESAGAVIASPGASSPDLTGKSRNFFRDYPSDSSQGNVIAGTLAKTGNKKVAIIAEQTDYALGIVKSFTTKFQELGGTVLKEEFPTVTKDFRSQLTKLKGSKPDTLFIIGQTPASVELILAQLAESGWKVQLAINDVPFGVPGFTEKHKSQLEGTITAEVGVDMANPKYKSLYDTYKSTYNVELPFQSYAQDEYDIIFILKEGVEKVGYDGLKIADWARTLVNWDGASGPVTIGVDGDRVGGHRAEIVKNGKVEVLK